MNLLQLLQLLKPKVLLPLLNHEIDQEGPLASLLTERGNAQASAVRQLLVSKGMDTRVEMAAPPGETLAIAL